MKRIVFSGRTLSRCLHSRRVSEAPNYFGPCTANLAHNQSQPPSILAGNHTSTFQITQIRREQTDSNKTDDSSQSAGNQAPRKQYASRGNLIENLTSSIKEEMRKNKELQDNLAKLRGEKDKLEKAESVQFARKKFAMIEHEGVRAREVITKKLEDLTKQMKDAIEEAKKSEYGKKTLDATREAAESLEKAAKAAGDTAIYKTVATGMSAVKNEIDDATMKHAGMYSRPAELRTRQEYFSSTTHMTRTYEANTEATGIELHKEAKWSKSFRDWADSNPAFNKIHDWKMRFDESDNVAARVTRFFTDKVTSIFVGNELSEVMTEIQKVDPEFDKAEFMTFCEKIVIPNVLEALIRGDLPVLEDWCHERVYKTFAPAITAARQIGYKPASKILDISRIEILSGKMMEQGPVLVIQFSAHQIEAVVNRDGKVVEGNIEQPIKVDHIWAICRDLTELNPLAAWKVLEIHLSPQKNFVM